MKCSHELSHPLTMGVFKLKPVILHSVHEGSSATVRNKYNPYLQNVRDQTCVNNLKCDFLLFIEYMMESQLCGFKTLSHFFFILTKTILFVVFL